MRSLQSNIWKLYVIKGLRSCMFEMPIIVLFFRENGLSMRDVLVLQALFSLVTIVLDVPTGHFSDMFSRKVSIVIGGGVSTFGFAVYFVSSGFWEFLIAETILGVGMSFVSGADSAMLYDTLLVLNREGEYRRREGANSSTGLLSESVASIIGGFLAVASLRLPILCDVLVSLCIIPVALILVEPPLHREISQKSSLVIMWATVRYALYAHAEIKWLILYSSIVSTSTLTMVWFIQPYLVVTSVPIEWFGIVWSVLMGVAAFFSWYAHFVERVIGRKRSLVLLVALPVFGYGLIASVWHVWSAIFLVCFYITRGILNPVLLDYINGLISSDVRATILSVKNLVGRCVFVIVGPLAGWASDAYSLQSALLLSGSIFLFFGGVILLAMWKKKIL